MSEKAVNIQEVVKPERSGDDLTEGFKPGPPPPRKEPVNDQANSAPAKTTVRR